ncbi:MAG: sigma-70 family RNA polymerase sigma factor [Clostridia bacterium]|nr:sigma-70 family RNA polymerase sigma factor [Clostridia bacterium]
MTEDLLRRARAGDSRSFEMLVTTHEQTVWRVCWQMLGNSEDAADALQQTMLRAWQGIGSFRGEATLGTWLYRIAVSVCLDALRRRKARPQVSMDQLREEDGFDPPSREAGPEQALEQKEDREAVREALNSLSDEQRVPLTLFAVDQRPYEEIAELLSLPVGTVKSRISRGRMQLAKILRENGNYPGAAASKRVKGGPIHEL